MMESEEKKLNEIYLLKDEKAEIIQKLVEIINLFKKEYLEEFLIKDLIDHDYQVSFTNHIEKFEKKSKIVSYELLNKDKALQVLSKKKIDKDRIFSLLEDVIKDHPKLSFNHILDLFKIVLEIKDFVLSGFPHEIERRHECSDHFINSTKKLVFFENTPINWYERRFYQNKFVERDLFAFADEVSEEIIIKRDFENLLHPQLQELFTYYRTQHNIKMGDSLFTRSIIETQFTRWLAEIDPEKLSQILKKFERKLDVKELLILCSQINKNLEILKFIAYTLINTSFTRQRISEISGKSVQFIKKYAKLIYYKRVL